MKKKNIRLINLIIKVLIYIISYGIVLMLVSYLFRSFFIENFLYGLLASIIISVLNLTIKPIMFKLTLPLTGLTFGLFYFVNNMIILKITDVILGNHFVLSKFFVIFIIAIIVSLVNQLVDDLILKPFIRRIKIYE